MNKPLVPYTCREARSINKTIKVEYFLKELKTLIGTVVFVLVLSRSFAQNEGINQDGGR